MVVLSLPGTNRVGLEDRAARARRYRGQRLGDLGHRGADAVGQGFQCREVETVDCRRVSAEDRRYLVGWDVGEGVAQRFSGEGGCSFEVWVVASPHDAVDADVVTLGALDGSHEAGAHIALARPE